MRRKPYTATGIRRAKCCKCGAQGHASWQVCADGRQHRVLCKKHDIELNEKTLVWALGKEAAKPKIAAYRKKLESAQ